MTTQVARRFAGPGLLALALIIGMAAVATRAAQPGTAPDLIVVNGQVFTGAGAPM